MSLAVSRNCLHLSCVFLSESIKSLKKKYSQSSEPTDSDTAIGRTLNEVAKEGCQFLLDEVFLDLEVREALINDKCFITNTNSFICVVRCLDHLLRSVGGYKMKLKGQFTPRHFPTQLSC